MVENNGERVLVMSPTGHIHPLTSREAFDLVTVLLTAIDGARSYGAAKRGEIAEPDADRHKNRRKPKT